MATVTFTFTGGIGPDFNVIMTHAGATGSPPGAGNNVNTTPITNVLARDPNNGNAIIGPAGGWTPAFDSATASVRQKLDVPLSIIGSPLCEYVTWRTENASVHPTTGYSFDIWYPDATRQQTVLTGIFNSAFTWGQWAAETTLAIHPSYWTVLYDYTNQYAIGWKRGGNLLVTLS